MKTNRILWSVDAFNPTPDLERQALGLIGQLNKLTKFKVQPAFVQSDIFLNETDFHNDAELSLRNVVSRSRLPLLPGKIIRNPLAPYSLSKQVDVLLKFASKFRADLILAHTANRKGAERLFLGSFAETLLLKARRPVLFINPRTRTLRIRKILFATDLSAKSFQSFKKAVAWAQSSQAQIILFHRLRTNEKPPSFSKWLQEGKKSKVKVSPLVNKSPKRVTEALLESARSTGCDLIAMTSQAGPISTFLVGSITRQVLRESPCPVMVLN